jgi:hypothetical protein
LIAKLSCRVYLPSENIMAALFETLESLTPDLVVRDGTLTSGKVVAFKPLDEDESLNFVDTDQSENY